MEEQKQLSIEDLEQVGFAFVKFMKVEYEELKKEYHKNEHVKKMMDLPSFCYTRFLIAIKSHSNPNIEE